MKATNDAVVSHQTVTARNGRGTAHILRFVIAAKCYRDARLAISLVLCAMNQHTTSQGIRCPKSKRYKGLCVCVYLGEHCSGITSVAGVQTPAVEVAHDSSGAGKIAVYGTFPKSVVSRNKCLLQTLDRLGIQVRLLFKER